MTICINCGKSIVIGYIEEDEVPDADGDETGAYPLPYEPVYKFHWTTQNGKDSDCKKGCGHSPEFGVVLPRKV